MGLGDCTAPAREPTTTESFVERINSARERVYTSRMNLERNLDSLIGGAPEEPYNEKPTENCPGQFGQIDMALDALYDEVAKLEDLSGRYTSANL